MTHRGLIDQMMVGSKYEYIVYGSVRGLVSEHRTESGALRSLASDQRACSGLPGGGAYSDCDVMVWTPEGWSPAGYDQLDE